MHGGAHDRLQVTNPWSGGVRLRDALLLIAHRRRSLHLIQRVVTRLSAIDIACGSEVLCRDQMPGLLTELAGRARVLWQARTVGIRCVGVERRSKCPGPD